jgi:NodT family efflux transporter outer membrane factor (OMF) lipoprotein
MSAQGNPKSLEPPITADAAPMAADKGDRSRMVMNPLRPASGTNTHFSSGLSAVIGVASAYIGGSALLVFLLAGCAIGPNYAKPEVVVPAEWKEAGDWVVATPSDALPKGKWWEAFNDPVLNELMEEVSVSNQNLKAAEARYRQARSAVQAARAALFPTLGGSAGATRSRDPRQRYSVALDARWEIDLWGRIRRLVEAARAGEEASAADLEGAKLSLQAELATSYFQLRVADVTRELLEDSVKAFQVSYNVTQNRYRAGVDAKVDVVQAVTQLLSTQAQAIDIRITRAQLEHAIAVLIGRPPALVTIEPRSFKVRIPDVPPGLPSTLLERRPDVGAAERRMAAANARIGVAQAAYFPALSLTGSAGFASNSLSTLFSAPSRFWSIGLGLAGTLLDFGGRSAEVDISRAAYDETVAAYRETVLEAFQEVEDNLVAVRMLAEEGKVQQEAARAARESVTLTVNQYKAGTVSYLNVVQVQATQLAEERSTVNLLGRRLTATVALIRALGGDWGSPSPLGEGRGEGRP